MEHLGAEYREEVLCYVMAETEHNLFIIGDIENLGMTHAQMAVYGQRGSDGHLCCLLLRYLDNHVFYAKDEDKFDVDDVAAQIRAWGKRAASAEKPKQWPVWLPPSRNGSWSKRLWRGLQGWIIPKRKCQNYGPLRPGMRLQW